MHRSETIDYGIILSGEIYLVLDDSEVLCKQGDVIVQRGTSHAWSNRSDEPCRVAFVLIDAKFGADLIAFLELLFNRNQGGILHFPIETLRKYNKMTDGDLAQIYAAEGHAH